MESNIVSKLKVLNFAKEIQPTTNKFVASISDGVVSLENVTDFVNWLAGKGIVIKRPSQMKVLAVTTSNKSFREALKKVEEIKLVSKNGGSIDQVEGLEELRELVDTINRIEEMERMGEIGAYIEDPVRILSKGAVKRIKYLRNAGEAYKTPEGKYYKLPFRKTEFENKYGTAYLGNVENVEKAKDIKKVTEVISAPVKEEVPKDAGLVDGVTTSNEFVNPLDEILSKPQTISLNDETFDRYERLSDAISHIMYSVYGVEEVNDSIINNLIKLVTNEVADNKDVIYASITYGKTISPEEAQKLNGAIDEELSYTGILDINLGGMAA